MSYCDECPYNSGVRGEEIICDLNQDTRDCPHKKKVAE